MRRRRYFSGADDAEAEENWFTLEKSMGIWSSPQYRELQLPDGALADSVNIIPGTWQKINYYPSSNQTTSTTLGRIKGLHVFRLSSGLKIVVFAVGGIVKTLTNTTVDSGLSDNNFEFVTYNDICYYVNGDNGLRRYDGASAGAVTPYTTSASEPANYLADAGHAIHDSRYIAVHDGVLYAASPRSQPYRLYRSDEVVGPTYFHHYVDVPSNQAGAITWMKSFNGVLIIFKTDSIWAADGLIGDDTFRLRPLNLGVGCAFGRTVQEVPGLGLVFLGSDRQVYVLRPDSVNGEHVPVFKLSSHISDILDETLGFDYGQRPCAGVFKNQYWLSIPIHVGGSPTTWTHNLRVLAFDASKAAPMPNSTTDIFVPWGVYSTFYAAVYATDIDTTWYGQDVDGTSAAGGVYYVEENSSPNVTAWFYTQPLYFGDAGRRKLLPRLQANVRQQNGSTLNISCATDNAPFETVASQTLNPLDSIIRFAPSTTGNQQSSMFETYTIPVWKQGRVFQFKFDSSTSATDIMEITQIRFAYVPQDVR